MLQNCSRLGGELICLLPCKLIYLLITLYTNVVRHSQTIFALRTGDLSAWMAA